MPMEAADMMVILKDKKEWTSAESFNELANKMNAGFTVSKKVPDARATWKQYKYFTYPNGSTDCEYGFKTLAEVENLINRRAK